MDKPRIANLNDLTESMERSHGERYEARHFPVGPALAFKNAGVDYWAGED